MIGFKRDHDKQGLGEVTITGGVYIEIVGVNDVHSGVVTNHLIYFHLLGTSNNGNGYLAGLIVIVHRLLDFIRGALLIGVRGCRSSFVQQQPTFLLTVGSVEAS